MIRRLPETPAGPHNLGMGWGSRIAQARKEAGLNQTQLGEAVGAGQPTVSEWEREENEPNFATILRIAKATKVNPCWLAFGDQFPDPLDKLLKVYDSLDQAGKSWLESTVQRELDRLDTPRPHRG